MNRFLPARISIIVAIAAIVSACAGSGTGGAPLPTIPSEAPATPTPVPTHPGPTYPPSCPTSQPAALGTDQTRTVTITTDKGKIVIRVEGKLSPIATGNFVALASCGYYDGVVFHRVVPDFVIQGGDGAFARSPNVVPGLAGTGGPPYTIKDEKVTAKYMRGTVAMARTADPDSAGSQFFIVLSGKATAPLERENTYQILGSVISGMDVADAIAAAAGGLEAPASPVVMTSVTVAEP